MRYVINSTIDRSHLFSQKVMRFLIQWRTVVLIIITAYITIFELGEHPDFLSDSAYYFTVEITLFLALIIITAFMIEIALKAALIKNQTIRILDARHNLSMLLTTAKDWDEVVTKVLEYPSSIMPVSATSLMIYDQITDQYYTERSWIADNEEITIPPMAISGDACCVDDIQDISTNIHIADCEKIASVPDGTYKCYHLLLDYGKIPVGILSIILPKQQDFNSTHAQLLSKTAEDIAIGLSAAKHRQLQHAIEVANAASNERLEIARDLHDTLGQNLGYLHFKLDQILAEDLGISCSAKRSELVRLRELANESYELVRNTLVILHHKDEHRISELFKAHSQMISKRAEFSVSIEEEGLPRSIPPNSIKQLLHAFKESLYNIEKHSGASQVKVFLTWTDTQLTVRIWDDGCGFEVQEFSETGHYGLHIIDERIQSLGGKVEINSTPGQGTEVMFWLPVSTPEKLPSELLIGGS